MRPPLILLVFLLANIAIADPAKLAFFESHVRPVLIEHCDECHSADAKKVKGGLLLDSRVGWKVGGDSGQSIVPGDPETSLLMTAVGYQDGDLKMPPKYRLAEADVANLKQWIADGAVDPREGDVSAVSRGEIDLDAGREFWSFRPLRSSQPPQDGSDHFVLEKLAEAGLPPAPKASRRALIRRASYDLLGLPPAPAEIADFLADSREDAFARVVDRLLARTEFGEHWGRHWLDVARFAESSGGGRSLMYPVAWRFRDYVIDAMNADKPFDQFIREQIAGDLLPWETPQQRNEQLVASGYLLLGPTNYELQDKALLEMDVIDEQIDTIGRGFLGMSLGCARCHDHKFDPVPTADYYALAGIFASTDVITPGNVSGYTKRTLERFAPITGAETAHSEKVAALTAELAAVKTKLGQFPKRTRRGVDPATLTGIVVDDRDAEKVGSWLESTHTMNFVADNYLHDSHGNAGPSKVIFRPKIEVGGQYDVRVSYSASGNRATNTLAVVDHADGRSEIRINQTKTPPIDGSFLSLGTFRLEADIAIAVTIDNDSADGVVIVDAVQVLRPGIDLSPDVVTATSPAEPPEMLPAERKQLDAEAKRLDKALTGLKKKAKYKPEVAMAVKDSGAPANGHIHIRGGVRNLGPKVPRGFLRVAMTPESAATPPTIAKGSGRLELAEWLVSPENPLTARVTVNRLWHHLFGVGIVRTVDNFGKTGELPSHPELLDFLANRFVADGWSVKREIRRMMLSRTYQMAATGDAGMAADPENRLLWRARRRRLAAEGLRDAMLVISGQLDPERGGLTIHKLTQYDQNYVFKTRRRGVYVPAFRNSVLPLFEVFDAANSNLVVGARNSSNLATQALYLMNSPFVSDQAMHTAARLVKEQPAERRLGHLYEYTLGRLPRADERRLAEAHLTSFTGNNAESAAWTSICHTLFACIDFRFID